MQQLISCYSIQPYYWSSEKGPGEIDFVFQWDMNIIPVEVKTEENLKVKILKAYCDKYNPKYAVRTSMSNYRTEEWMRNVPLYGIPVYWKMD